MRRALARGFGRGDVVLIVVASAAALRVWLPAPPLARVRDEPHALHARPSASMPGALRDSLDAAVERLIASNPFRTESEAGTNQGVLPGATPPAVAALLPRGVVGPPATAGVTLQALAGPPWTAVVAGLPGRPGQAVLTVGDSAGEFRVTAIRRDTVILQSKDSTLRLVLPKETR